ncbi:MAG: GH32 C-terminal domain-containing protein [Liquorilactobacillus nagelii]|nr:GH32 C-terminal domain-containing protein [Liquorilactobacillus nagelii]
MRQKQSLLRDKVAPAQEKTLVEKPGQQYELQLTLPADIQGSLQLFRDQSQKQGFKINFNTNQAAHLEVDRSQAGQQFALDYGTKRQVELTAHHPLFLDIFVDNSICEIFVNHGEFVFSQRIFPQLQAAKQITLEADQEIIYNGCWWQLAE